MPCKHLPKTDLIHRQEMRPIRHGGSRFVNNYSNHPRMCVLSTLCVNDDKHSPFDIYIYIYCLCDKSLHCRQCTHVLQFLAKVLLVYRVLVKLFKYLVCFPYDSLACLAERDWTWVCFDIRWHVSSSRILAISVYNIKLLLAWINTAWRSEDFYIVHDRFLSIA